MTVERLRWGNEVLRKRIQPGDAEAEFEKMQRNGVMECSVCHSKVVATPRSISRAYDKHKSKISSKQRVLNFLLVSGDYVLVGLQVTVPSFASIYNEYALKSQFDTNIYLQNVFLYGYGANFSLLGILGTVVFQGPECG
ncbi:hypothetical protein ZWY2020_038417 [Hordeum vulgare]|nr:hypothetical protein ZWY2020_038417 [Hordeum vulgare]